VLSFEPFTEFASVRKLDAGDFWVTNGPLTKWVLENCPEDAEKILAQVTQTNSVQGIPQLKPVAHIYRTAFEIDQKTQMEHVECMLPFIDQSLSHNLFIPRHSPEGHHFQAVIAGLLYTSWSRGWKHGTYYTHIEKESHAPSYKSDSGNLTASASASDQDSPQVCRMEPGCTSCES
jgi:ribonucleotide reductase alpha subunit